MRRRLTVALAVAFVGGSTVFAQAQAPESPVRLLLSSSIGAEVLPGRVLASGRAASASTPRWLSEPDASVPGPTA